MVYKIWNNEKKEHDIMINYYFINIIWQKSHIEFLTNKLAINNNPSSRDIEVMACQINLTETQIYHWFYQKRKHMK